MRTEGGVGLWSLYITAIGICIALTIINPGG